MLAVRGRHMRDLPADDRFHIPVDLFCCERMGRQAAHVVLVVVLMAVLLRVGIGLRGLGLLLGPRDLALPLLLLLVLGVPLLVVLLLGVVVLVLLLLLVLVLKGEPLRREFEQLFEGAFLRRRQILDPGSERPARFDQVFQHVETLARWLLVYALTFAEQKDGYRCCDCRLQDYDPGTRSLPPWVCWTRPTPSDPKYLTSHMPNCEIKSPKRNKRRKEEKKAPNSQHPSTPSP